MRSVEKDPYLIGSWGRARFVIDLAILLVYYLLLSIVSNNDLWDDSQIFAFIPIVFLLYFIWDVFKEKEHQEDHERLANIRRRTGITRKYLVAITCFSVIYFVVYISFFNLNWNDVEFWINILDWHVEGWTHFLNLNLLFVGIFLFLVIRYRYAKADKQRHKRIT